MLTLWSVPFSYTGLQAFALMSESRLGAEENVDPSGGSLLESTESIPVTLLNTHRRHCFWRMMSRSLVAVEEFAAYLQHSNTVTQFASLGCMALGFLFVRDTKHPPKNVQRGGCVHCSLPPHAPVVHLAAVQHRARRPKPGVAVSLTYELTKSVSTTLHKILRLL